MGQHSSGCHHLFHELQMLTLSANLLFLLFWCDFPSAEHDAERVESRSVYWKCPFSGLWTKKSVCPPTPLSHWLTDPSQVDPSATAAVGKPAPGARRMVAIFDYDPRESSPNTDIEVRTADAFFLLYGAEMFADYLLCLLCPCPGWADLQCWRYHTCVWWHGRRWLLLRKSEND